MSEPKSADESFNEAELEDIMSEIENLEKDFSQAPAEVGGTEEFKELSPDEIPSDDDILDETVGEDKVEVEHDGPAPASSDADLEAFEAELLGGEERVSESEDLRVDSAVAGKTELQTEIEREMTKILESSKDLALVSEAPESEGVMESPEEPVEPQTVHAEAPVISMKSREETRVSFQVNGQMSLGFDLSIGGRSIKLSVCEDELVIELEEGAKFSLPFKHRKAA